MKVLATAKRNELYVWNQTFKKVVIIAALENDHIVFLEYFNNNVNTLSEDLVQSLFPRENIPETPIRDCPFLVKDNENFYAVLHRKNVLYKEKFEEILELSNKPKIIRTTVPEVKKTFKRTK